MTNNIPGYGTHTVLFKVKSAGEIVGTFNTLKEAEDYISLQATGTYDIIQQTLVDFACVVRQITK